MRYIVLVVAASVAAGIAAPSMAQSSAASPNVPEIGRSSAVLRPGDIVQITVWRKPELSGEFFVATDGAIADPYYQEVNVAGISPEMATERVRRFLEQIENNPRVRVDPLYRVSVSGHVRQPKLYSLRPEYTISEAIDEAGGPAERGRAGRVRLYRDGQVRELSLGGGEPSAATMQIQSGDRIVLEQRTHLLKDVVLPTVSFVGSIASLVHIWIRYTR